MSNAHRPNKDIYDSLPSEEQEDWVVNIASARIVITEDKLENCLLKYGEHLATRKAWITPITLLISCIITLFSSTFNNKLGIPADTWKAIFIISIVCCILWLIKTIYDMVINYKKGSIENLIAVIKGGNDY